MFHSRDALIEDSYDELDPDNSSKECNNTAWDIYIHLEADAMSPINKHWLSDFVAQAQNPYKFYCQQIFSLLIRSKWR